MLAPEVQGNPTPVSPREAIAIADRTPQVRSERRRHPELRLEKVTLYERTMTWVISYLAGEDRLADITVDARTGEVVQAWQGVQAGWVMARGNAGYFGATFEKWYVWLPLCLLFVAPFFDPRRPLRMLHLDLLVLVGGFGSRTSSSTRARSGRRCRSCTRCSRTSSRACWSRGSGRAARVSRSCRSSRPRCSWPAIVLLGGLRIGLDLTEGKVSDVGYASAVGATRIQTHQASVQGQRQGRASLRHVRARQLPRL